MKNKKIGVCRGCSFGPVFENAKKHFFIDEDNNNNIRLVKLLKGRIDVAVISPGRYALNDIIKKNPKFNKKQFSVLTKPLTYDANYMAFRKSMNRKSFLKNFNKALKKLKKAGVVARIIKKYSH